MRRGAGRPRSPDRTAEGAERGSATLNLVVVFPAFLLLLMLAVQAALVIHARHVAQAAADEGLRQARLYDGSGPAGRVRAEDFLTETGNGLFTTTAVSANRSPTTASVRVTGTALSLVPGIHLAVRAVAAGPVERFTVG